MKPVVFELIIHWANIVAVHAYGLGLFFTTVICFLLFIKAISRYLGTNRSELLFLQIALLFYISSYLFYKLMLILGLQLVVENPGQGFSFYPGFICVVLFLVLKYKDKSAFLFRLLDHMCSLALFSIILMSLVSIFAGSSFGIPTLTRLGIDQSSNPLMLSHTQKVHPVQMYYVINAFILVIIIRLVQKRVESYGFAFLTFVLVWPIFSGVTEFFRGDLQRTLYGLTLFQLIVLLAMIIIVPLFFLLNARYNFLNRLRALELVQESEPAELLRLLLFRVNSLKGFFAQLKFVLIICLTFFLLVMPGQYWSGDFGQGSRTYSINDDSKKVFVNIPAMSLYYLGKRYLISVGRPRFQTPIGSGIIVDKRKKIRFVYTVGWRKGEVITYGHDLKGGVFKLQYNNMRGLGIRIGEYTDYVIHATTEDWNIGRAASSGCIRMRIPDMLKLYAEVQVNTPIIIDYILCEVKGDDLILYPDVYNFNACIIEGERIAFPKYAKELVLCCRPSYLDITLYLFI